MKAGIKVECLVWWEKSKSLSSLELHEEVVSCIIVGVSDDSFSAYPQVYLIEGKDGILQTYIHTHICTLGKMFVKLITCRVGPVRTKGTSKGWKHKKTSYHGKMVEKEDKKTNLHLLYIQLGVKNFL